MKNKHLKLTKLIFLIICTVLIIYAWNINSESILMAAAILYLSTLTIGLVSLIYDSKKYRDGKFILENPALRKKLIDITISLLEGLILVFGLVAMISKNEGITLVGTVIWFGAFGIYLFYGLVAKSITYLPLKMGYGGWFLPRPRKRK